MKRSALLLALCTLAAGLAGCASTIVPLEPIRRIAAEPATATAPATTLAATTAPADRIVDPNQTVRFLYGGNYDRIWQESTDLLGRLGYRLDRQDYRLGILTTLPLVGPQVVEPWRPDHTGIKHAFEDTINSQRRIVRLTIRPAEDRPNYFEIAAQVIVERRTNPRELIGGPIYGGSGFGRGSITLQSDYIDPQTEAPRWNTLGRDPAQEKKILDKLFKKI